MHPGRQQSTTGTARIFLAVLLALSGSALAAPGPAQADFKAEAASAAARHVANWVAESKDNQGMPYLIVDKVDAKVFAFDGRGNLLGAQPALLGMGIGDGSSAGVGSRKMAAISPTERTTPAGRFVASQSRDLKGQDILWIDYEAAIALHRVVKGLPEENRAARLASATPEDNRISYGCINVPVAFYDRIIRPTFSQTNGIVYILPETQAGQNVFQPVQGD